MMTLKKFRVRNFRSIIDSGWIECDNVTALVGINEAGKSNVILALWKLNPVRDGKIDLLHDMPTKHYSEWRGEPQNKVFITAEYVLDDELIDNVVGICGCTREVASVVHINRYYNGKYSVSFPNYKRVITIKSACIEDIVTNSIEQLTKADEKVKVDGSIKGRAIEAYQSILTYLEPKDILDADDFNVIDEKCNINHKYYATSDVIPIIENTKDAINNAFSVLQATNPANEEEVGQFVVSEMPGYVYYSNYGNLDSQIYLPHAIKWLNGEKIEGIDNAAKVRTLKVLFDFVKLNPKEVLELGMDPRRIVEDAYGRTSEKKPSEEEINKATEQKAARTILLNSASSKLTTEFKEWWKQGEYRFRLQADGEFFKIWVSDDKRSEEIELERRSTGLQWFLSFFLVFLVESQEAHKGAILLLDEAGLSLHPLAQKDLIAFFENLSKTNQIIYTTHSPFLVDTSNIDRAKVVYSDSDGLTVVSSNLRASDDKLNEKSIYAVHAALGLSVSDILLQGCQPIIVEGPSDQNYLNAIKIYLIRNQKYHPTRELIFIPSGGVRGVSGVVSIVSGKEGNLPFVILDSDKSGVDAKKKLTSGLYSDMPEKIINIGDITNIDNSEVEDIVPLDLMTRPLDRLFREIEDEDVMDNLQEGDPLIPQIESFARKYNVDLSSQKGWKVDLSKNVKQQLSKAKTVDEKYINMWVELFEKFSE